MVEEQSANLNMDNTNYSDDDEADEMISLCDYCFTSSNYIAAEGEDYSSQILPKSSSSSFSAGSDQELHFEFCSEEWSNSIVSDEYSPAENIIFCGKIITSDEPTSQLNLQNLMLRINKETRNGKPGAAEYHSFRWDGSHNTNRRKAEMFMIKKEDQELRKVSVRKMRWSLFFLGGIRRFQTEKAWRDIKSRQSRLGLSSTLFRLDNDGGDKKKKKMMMSNGISKNRRQQQGGPWGLLKAFSCGGQRHANSIANASIIGCIPRL